MPLVRETRSVPMPVERAAELWINLDRWATFIEGFAHVVEVAPEWPDTGSKLVWQSVPDGRGRVTERVLSWVPPGGGPGRFSTQVFEESLVGTQTVVFETAEDGSRVTIELQYELQPTSFSRQGVIGKLSDLFFIRRALSDSLARTLRRFSVEAAEELAL